MSLPRYITDYWGRAADGGTTWHPAAYHLLDVAAAAEAVLTEMRPGRPRASYPNGP